jgi:hypothetical protein
MGVAKAWLSAVSRPARPHARPDFLVCAQVGAQPVLLVKSNLLAKLRRDWYK